ncbi:UNVERIFIED_CONTAM: hypothetical protein Sradi_6092600 [Sesamum radiatum]|uniref:Uncharacterized protein n=1 Tax=Sesamum radiatum TaxID=300843 RepID=A0AAW2KJW6_SESRA
MKMKMFFCTSSFSLQLLLTLVSIVHSFPVCSTNQNAAKVVPDKILSPTWIHWNWKPCSRLWKPFPLIRTGELHTPTPVNQPHPGLELSADTQLLTTVSMSPGLILAPTKSIVQELSHIPFTNLSPPTLESIFIFQCFTQAPARIQSLQQPLHFFPPTAELEIKFCSYWHNLTSTFLSQISPNPDIITKQADGEIPVEIFSLSSLVHLDLSYNILTGSIPLEIGNLRNLVGLDFSYNKLTGPIPSALGNLRILQKLDLSSNSLSGKIPDTIQQLNSLVFFALSNNKFQGTFPRGLTGLQNLQYFLMDNNPMFVSLPLELSHLQKLQELRLSNSGYSGTIPSAYSQLMNLSSLSLENNRLSGRIPTGFLQSFPHLPPESQQELS